MAGVRPLKQSNNVFNNESDQITSAQLPRRAAAAQHECLTKLTFEPTLMKAIAPEDVVSYKLDGEQGKVFRLHSLSR